MATLQRSASRWEITALSINDVVGSGIYLLPAAAAALLGPSSLWAVILAGLAVMLVVLCFAEAASYFEEPGSAYLYARTAFGELVGFQVGWMTWLTRVTSLASLTAGSAQAIAFLWPGANVGAGRTMTIILLLALLTAINVRGTRAGIMTSTVLAIGKLIPLLIFVAVGALAASAETWSTQTATRSGGFGEAVLLLLYAYAGFENTAAAAGEYHNPRRNVPFALIAQITLVTSLYAAVQLVSLMVLPNLGSSETPLADAAHLLLGSPGGWLLTIGAVVSIVGTTGNTVFFGPRYLFALARDGYGPSFLAAVHPRLRTPAAAILTQSAIALPLALGGSFVHLAALSVVVRLSAYLSTAAAVPILRRKLTAPEGSFRLPGGPIIPLAAMAMALVFASSATRTNLISAAVAIGVGFVIYAMRRAPDEN